MTRVSCFFGGPKAHGQSGQALAWLKNADFHTDYAGHQRVGKRIIY